MEEIIVNDIDVSACYNRTPYRNDYGEVQCKCFRVEDPDDWEVLLFGICEQHPDCHYKQLKRKEKECEELKEKVELLEAQMDYNKSELELRLANEIKRNEFLLEEFSKADKNKDNWREQAEKCEKTLQEIQGVLEPFKCSHPETCWMNRDEGTGDILGCEPDDVKTIAECPSKVATCILNIIEKEI